MYTEGNYIYLLTYDIYDEMLDTYSELEGTEFAIELLIDGYFAASATGSFK